MTDNSKITPLDPNLTPMAAIQRVGVYVLPGTEQPNTALMAYDLCMMAVGANVPLQTLLQRITACYRQWQMIEQGKEPTA